ncbi:serine/threonine protein kinase [Streptomyces sp. WAC06614]|nr:serine/threonine protein kinase [Streptomyces sp. WAC06614]
MGQVWEAHDERLGRSVAVKLISLLAGGGSRGDDARARFLREAQITAQLQHPNIVTLHDLGETGTGDDRVPFLVMELVRGEGLDALLSRGAVSLPEAARWGAQMADALAAAHDAGIMHRDIKPSNVLITPAGHVKVLDFGIARAADPYATADRITRTGFIVGTPPYMAPEQARGFPEPSSDLYALGCVLFELITGRLPFQAPDTVSHLSAHLTQEPPAPSSVSERVPAAWDTLVLKLLRKDPAQRYPDAAHVARALRRLDGAPTTPLPPVETEAVTRRSERIRVPRTAPRWRSAGGLLSATLIVAIVGLFGYAGLFVYVIGGDAKDAQAGDCLWFDTRADRAKYGYTYADVAKTEPCALPFTMFGNSHFVVVKRIDGTSDPAECRRVPGAVVDADTAVLKSAGPPAWVLCVKPA